MVYTRDITLITSSITVDSGVDQYVIDATSAGATVTLNAINSDGEYYNFIRRDSTNGIVTIVPGASEQFIWGNGSSTSTFTLPGKSSIAFVSLAGNWYMTQNSSIGEVGTRTYFSSSYRQNNGSLFIQVRGISPYSNNNTSISNFVFEGTNSAQLSFFSMIVGVNKTSYNFRLQLTDFKGNVYADYEGNLATDNEPYAVTFPVTGSLPSNEIILEIRANIEGGSDGRLYIYSLRIY